MTEIEVEVAILFFYREVIDKVIKTLWLFFMVQLSHPYVTTGKTIALTRRTFVSKCVCQMCQNERNAVFFFFKTSRMLYHFYSKKKKRKKEREKGINCFQGTSWQSSGILTTNSPGSVPAWGTKPHKASSVAKTTERQKTVSKTKLPSTTSKYC